MQVVGSRARFVRVESAVVSLRAVEARVDGLGGNVRTVAGFVLRSLEVVRLINLYHLELVAPAQYPLLHGWVVGGGWRAVGRARVERRDHVIHHRLLCAGVVAQYVHDVLSIDVE